MTCSLFAHVPALDLEIGDRLLEHDGLQVEAISATVLPDQVIHLRMSDETIWHVPMGRRFKVARCYQSGQVAA